MGQSHGWPLFVVLQPIIRGHAQATTLPQECLAFATCGAEWDDFRRVLELAAGSEATAPASAMEAYFGLMQMYMQDAGVALRCRMGAAAVFFRLGRQYMNLGFAQRAANLFQLAMSMFWDASRAENGMVCLQYELWGFKWFDDFMEVYLGHATKLQRNVATMLPYPSHWQVPANFRDPSLKIGVFSLCEYGPESAMHWLLARSSQNRRAYSQRHGYGMEWHSERPTFALSRHAVWGQVAGPLELLQESPARYDWIMSMDCDSLFVNMEVTIESVLYRFAARETPWGKLELDPSVFFLISEDGRGLAGGNWIVRNSPEGRQFLQSVYGPDDPEQNPYLRHDLRDQFSLLWHLVRPGVSTPLPPEHVASASLQPEAPQRWDDVGYLPGVRLVPQEFLLGAYPYVSCSQPGDRAHRCFRSGEEAVANIGQPAQPAQPTDFIVSVPLLGALPQNMAQALLDRFLLLGLGSLGQPAYEQELRGLCASSDISRCLIGDAGVVQ